MNPAASSSDKVAPLGKKLRLGDMLVQNKVISEAQLQTALAEQKKTGHKLGNTLIELGIVAEKSLLVFFVTAIENSVYRPRQLHTRP